jgi:transcriptional regulator with XRE-family HTH domain
VPNADSGAFGRTLAELRRARGFTQQDVAARISTYYGDAGTFGRIERGERHPDRDAVVAIVVRGLMIREIAVINRILQLAGYGVLTADEMETLALAQAIIEPSTEPASRLIAPRNPWRDWRSAAILISSLALAGVIASLIPRHGPFGLLTSCLYAALYVVSLYLESAFDPEHFPTPRTAVFTFALMSVSSTVALATDRDLVDSGNSFALLASLAIFLLAGFLQFAIVRGTLPESALVPATFQTQTAQSAHLKNTSYFLLIVLIFWLTPFHCVSTLSREVRSGHADWVRQMLSQDLMLGRGLLALSVRWLLGLLLAMFLLALYMGTHLLDNLRPHARLNSFTLLFYLRALLCFLLCLLSIGWYAYSLSDFA